MKKIMFALVAITVIVLSSCEVEMRDGHRYYHNHGWEHRYHPDHHEAYHHGWHHDHGGGEIILHN